MQLLNLKFLCVTRHKVRHKCISVSLTSPLPLTGWVDCFWYAADCRSFQPTVYHCSICMSPLVVSSRPWAVKLLSLVQSHTLPTSGGSVVVSASRLKQWLQCCIVVCFGPTTTLVFLPLSSAQFPWCHFHKDAEPYFLYLSNSLSSSSLNHLTTDEVWGAPIDRCQCTSNHGTSSAWDCSVNYW